VKEFVSVIMAAGLGTRMKSDRAKVLHPVLGKPMLYFPLQAVRALRPKAISVVVGHQAERVREAMGTDPGLVYALQKEQKGTADALKAGVAPLGKVRSTLLVLNGDMPLIRTETLKALIAFHRRQKNALTLSSFITPAPTGYGRVLRDDRDRVSGIVEQKDATTDQLRIPEVNGGLYVMEPGVLDLLSQIRPANRAGEYYLTDIVGLSVSEGLKVGACLVEEEDLRGVNSRKELAEAAGILRMRILEGLMADGVSVMQPGSVFIEPEVKVGRDTFIYPNVVIEGRSRIGAGCHIFPGVRIVNSKVEDGAVVKDGCVIEDSRIGPGCSVGPFAHLRPGSVLKKDVKVGNFVELKKAVLRDGAKASHLSYLGDAEIGRGVNIGAGTITCNYDGTHKHQTVIGEGVFIGSDTQLVAPVKVGKGAYVGAGSTITGDVPAGSLALTRVRQRNIEGWVKKRALVKGKK